MINVAWIQVNGHRKDNFQFCMLTPLILYFFFGQLSFFDQSFWH